MIRDLEDKMFREEDEARRERRMAEYTRRVRRRFDVLGASLQSPPVHVATAAQPRCDVFRVDTAGADAFARVAAIRDRIGPVDFDVVEELRKMRGDSE